VCVCVCACVCKCVCVSCSLSPFRSHSLSLVMRKKARVCVYASVCACHGLDSNNRTDIPFKYRDLIPPLSHPTFVAHHPQHTPPLHALPCPCSLFQSTGKKTDRQEAGLEALRGKIAGLQAMTPTVRKRKEGIECILKEPYTCTKAPSIHVCITPHNFTVAISHGCRLWGGYD